MIVADALSADSHPVVLWLRAHRGECPIGDNEEWDSAQEIHFFLYLVSLADCKYSTHAGFQI